MATSCSSCCCCGPQLVNFSSSSSSGSSSRAARSSKTQSGTKAATGGVSFRGERMAAEPTLKKNCSFPLLSAPSSSSLSTSDKSIRTSSDEARLSSTSDMPTSKKSFLYNHITTVATSVPLITGGREDCDLCKEGQAEPAFSKFVSVNLASLFCIPLCPQSAAANESFPGADALRSVFESIPLESLTSKEALESSLEFNAEKAAEVGQQLTNGVQQPGWLQPALVGFPVLVYLGFNVYRDKLNPSATLLDFLFLLATLFIILNLVTIVTLNIRLY